MWKEKFDTENEFVSAIIIPKSCLGISAKTYFPDKRAADICKNLVDIYGVFFDAQKEEAGRFVDYLFSRGPVCVRYSIRKSESGVECCGLAIEEPHIRVTHASLFISKMLETHLLSYRDDCAYRLGIFGEFGGGRVNEGKVLNLLGLVINSVASYTPNGYEEKVIEES